MENKKISVFLPAYNAEKTLERAIQSVVCQTYQNWEICVIDDGSRDGTAEIAERACQRDSRIRLFKLSPGKGKTYALKAGIEAVSEAEYAMFLDSDDWFKGPELFQRLIGELDRERADCVLFNFELKGAPGFQKLVKKMILSTEEEYVKNIMKRQYMDGNLWGGIYKFQLVKEKFTAQNFNHEDYINKYNILKECGKVVILPVIGYVYYVNTDSITHRPFTDRDEYYYIHAKEFVEKMQKIFPGTEKEGEYFMNWVLLFTASRLAENRQGRQLKMYQRIMKTARSSYKAFLWNPYFSTRDRLTFLLIWLGVYGMAHRIYIRIKRRQ